MWSFEHTEQTSASAAALWARYADPPSWPEWDHETERVTLDGPFVVGSRGTLKPRGAPTTSFEVMEVDEGRAFTGVSSLPLARLRFSHVIAPAGEGSTITHRVEISGPLSPLFSQVIGRKIAAGLPAAMRRLGELASHG